MTKPGCHLPRGLALPGPQSCDGRPPVGPSCDRPAREVSGRGSARVAALLAGVSLLALVTASGPGHALNLKSPGVVSPGAAAAAAQQAAAAQAAAAAQQAKESLAAAAAALQALRASQDAARSLAGQAGAAVPNGIAPGGLMPQGGVARDASSTAAETRWVVDGTDPTLWQGASRTVTETTSGGRTTVGVTQTEKKAILNWETFNVGSATTLAFGQQAADWTVLNRVGPSVAPSQILGSITAKGGVYVINRNGIIFGGGAQINTHALVASTLDVGQIGTDRQTRDGYFINTGIATGQAFSVYDPTGGVTTPLQADVLVHPGARITTDVVDLDSPGFVFLFGANVRNAGTISSPAGQVAMVAARQIEITPGVDAAAVFPSEVLPSDRTFKGVGFLIQNYATGYRATDGLSGSWKAGDPTDKAFKPGTGAVVNDGLIETPRGIVTLVGDKLRLGSTGVISADTGISRNSMVLMHATTSIDVDGVISMLPYDDPDTPTLPLGGGNGSTVQSFAPAFVELAAQSTVTTSGSGLISAPSASVSLTTLTFTNATSGAAGSRDLGIGTAQFNPSVSGPQRVLLAPGAVIDVAGLQDVVVPVSWNYVSFEPRSEFADMPLLRSSPLYGQELWIDIRASGTRSDGTAWIGTPLADASGVVSGVGRSIYQLMTTGGKVTLKTETTAPSTTQTGREVIQQAGSVVNMAGGSVRYTAGMVSTTRLLGIDGHIYSMENASPDMTYVGVFGQFTRNHERWGVKETWGLSSQRWEGGYVDGADAGGLTVSTVYPVLQSTMLFGSPAGDRQVGTGKLPSQGFLDLTTTSTVIIGANGTVLPADFATAYASTALPQTNPASAPIAVSDNFRSTSKFQTLLSADTLSSYGLSKLTITSNDLVVQKGSSLTLAAGGSLTATAGVIDIAGTVAAAGGSISLTTDPTKATSAVDSSRSVTASGRYDIFVGGTLDVAGRWVNDTGRFGADSGALGYAYIDGGTISIQTARANGSAGGADETGNIALAPSSVLDVSSGGYVSPRGDVRIASSGLMAGKGGKISLLLYQGSLWDEQKAPFKPGAGAVAAQIQLDGTLRAYGFESNGTLEIGAPLIVRIGGTLAAGEESAIRISAIDATKGVALPVSLFTDGGFGAYAIVSTPDDYSGKATGITVSAGAELTLRQVNLASRVDYGAVPTGTKIADVAPLAVQPIDRRKPVDLTLTGDTLLIDADVAHGSARIVTDPGATVTLAGRDDLVTSGRAVNVLIRGEIENHGGTVAINAQRTWFGPTAKIDLSGVFVGLSDFGLPNGPTVSGKVLAGGTLAIDATRKADLEPTAPSGATTETKLDLSGTYVVAEAGAVVDVSGATGTIVVPGTVTEPNKAFQAWSDAGTVRVNAGAFVWGGSFVANADPRANRGTLILGGSPTVGLRQTSTAVQAALAGAASPVTAAALTALTATPSLAAYNNTIEVAVADLGVFDDVYLYAGTSRGGAERIFTGLDGGTAIYNHRSPNLGSVLIRESIDWTVANRLNIAAQGIYATAAGVSARFAAPYVALTGGGARWTTPGTGTGTFTVAAQAIDVEGASVGGFGRVALVATNDIRLSTPKVVNGIDPTSKAETNAATFTGRLDLDGSLVMEAQRIYPVSAVDFTIQTPGTETVRAPAGSDTTLPLSAGGSLTVLAADIVQGGNLFAPLGKITLGNTNAAVSPIVTRSVTLVDGSLTSVTLADTVVPYGATLDGSNWYYNASLKPLATPPSKGLVLDGGTVVTSAAAMIDVRGGGDLQATEFVQGKNGSRDVLALPGVYALVPTRGDTIAAFDIHFTTADNARTAADAAASKPGDAYPLAGTQITIAGGGGIPAGTYTLYPAHYATLPGTYAVSVSGKMGGVTLGSAPGTRIASGTTLPDGTVLVTGQYTQSTAPGKTTSGTELFAIRSGSAWRQYSEYVFSGANAYFTRKAAHDGTVVPRLPVDAGRLAVSAQQQIVLDAIARTQPGPGGRGSELDLSAAKLAVVDHPLIAGNDPSLQALRAEGYVTFDVAQLDAIGFESVLFGGLRSDTATGTRIDAKSTQVLVDTRGEALSAPEILLVANQGPRTLQTVRYYLKADIDGTAPVDTMVEVPVYAPAAGSGTVTVASGSVIEARGTINAGAARSYYFDNPTVDPAAAAALATYLGGSFDGTTITGAQLTKLPLSVAGGVDANGATIWVPIGGSARPGTADYTSLVAALNAVYKPLSGAPGAIFAASSDAGLRIAGPTSDALVVSFANQGVYTLRNTVALSDNNAGRVVIQPGATVRAPDATVTIQATAHTDAIGLGPDTLVARQVDLRAPTVTIGATGPTAALRIVGDTFRRVEGLSVTALSGVVTLGGDFANDTLRRLTLDARTIFGTGTSASILTPNAAVTLVNSGTATATVPPAPAAGTFTIAASELVLGGGKQAILGFAAADWSASREMRVAASGTLALGFDPARIDTATGAAPASAPAVALTVTTPSILVAGASATGNGSKFDLITKGQARFTGRSGTDEPAPSAELGGSFAVTAAGIVLDTVLQAQSGTLALTATTGDLVLGDHAFVAAGGYAKTMVDQTVYVMGGKLTLTTDTGRVVTGSGSVIDLAQPAGGLGYGGELIISSTGSPVLDGQLRGSGGPGLGGRFKLTTKGELDTARFNALADALYAGGFGGLIEIRTRQGNLELREGHTLKANAVALTADGLVEGPGDGNGDGTVTQGETKWSLDPTGDTGRVIISGLIDARGYDGLTVDGTGQAGGQVALWGGNAVVLTGTDGGRAGGKILASTEHADERGGDVAIGVAWDAKWDAANKIGGIDLQAGAVVDVHGGTKGGLSGGTVTLRAPRDGRDDVKIQRIESTITGARAVGIEAYVAFSTSGEGGIGNVGWDGIVDPAGYYKVLPNGQIILENGTWSGVGGWTLAIGGTYTSAPVVAINGVNQTTVLKVASSTLSVSSGGEYTSAPTVNYLVDGVVVARGTAPVRLSTLTIANGPSGITNGAPVLANFVQIGTALVQSGVLVGVTLSPTTNLTSMPSSLQIISGGVKTVTNGAGGVSFSGRVAVTNGAVTGITSLASFSGTPTIAIDPTNAVGGATATVNAAASTVGLGVSVKIASGTGYAAAPTAAAVSINGVTCAAATCTWTAASSGTGQLVDGVFVAENFVPRTGTYSTTTPTSIGTASYTPSTGAGNAHYTFYNDTLVKVVDGTWTYYGASYGVSNAVSRLLVPLAQKLGEGVVHLTPGVELINPVTWANRGDITVVSNWNLAAGTAYNPTTGTTLANGSKYVQVGDPSGAQPSYVDLLYRYIGDYGTGRKFVEPGALTLRALNDVKINASISDGFFQFGNTLDDTYRASVATYLNNTLLSNPTIDNGLYYIGGYSSTFSMPVVPYRAASNGTSPTTDALAAADLFPNQLRVCVSTNCDPRAGAVEVATVTDPGSWSYRITAGADTASANPGAMRAPTGATRGDIVVDGHATVNLSYRQGSTTATTSVDLATMVRTGTGDITLRAARDVILADTAAPGVIYAAGVNTPKLAGPGYASVGGVVVAANPDGFYEPVLVGYGAPSSKDLEIAGGLYGPVTAAAFPHKGGDVDIEAQRDIVGYAGSTATARAGYQYYEPWLLALTGTSSFELVTISGVDVLLGTLGAGSYAPGATTNRPQTAWWLQYGSFRQGILSAGGDVTLTAGRDIKDVSVSLPTTGRVSGGLVSRASGTLSTPVVHLYDSGTMAVRAGRDLLGGAYYQGSGHGTVMARGAVGAYGTIKNLTSSSVTLPNVPVLAVDTGRLFVTAGGALTVASPVNPAALHQQAQVTAKGTSATYMDTYGPDSLVSLTAVSGDLTIRVAPTSIGTGSAADTSGQQKTVPVSAAATYPASFAAVAVSGDIVTTGIVASRDLQFGTVGMALSGSEHGSLRLLADGSIDLTFGYQNGTFSGISGTLGAVPPPYVSAGPALLDAAFDPFRPNAWYGTRAGAPTFAGEALSRPVLAHADDAAVARIYAVTGDIRAAGATTRVDRTITGLIRVELNQPAEIYAGRDIVDLNLIVQNTAASDVSSVIAGRDITYTGYNNAGGLRVAGPGTFLVQAGRDLGPFVAPALNTPDRLLQQQGIASVGNASETPVGNVRVSGQPIGLYNAALVGPYEKGYNVDKSRNSLLGRTGADLVVLFGVAGGLDTAAMAATYIDPVNATTVAHSYASEFEAFLARMNIARDPSRSLVDAFAALSPNLKTVFASQILFAELTAVGESVKTGADYARGYTAVSTLFPARLGYTANDLTGGSNGANARVSTGDLDLRHATIQTRFGGDVSILGPGGDIIVGSLATEPNTNLKLRDLGLMTFAGGRIGTFTDGSVLVNSSRVLTTQGGDVLMWSSNGDLDTGRGSKTTLSLPPLQVEYDTDAYQTVDLGGLVTGAGIGVLKTSRLARTSNIYLLAPRGIIDAGTAGIRNDDGNLTLGAVTIVNADNIKVGGSTTGVPTVTAPNVGGLTAASNAAGAAAKPAETPTAGGRGDQASVFVVQVVGYGGGDADGGATASPSATPSPAVAPSAAGPSAPAPSAAPTGSGAPAGAGTPAGRSSRPGDDTDDPGRR